MRASRRSGVLQRGGASPKRACPDAAPPETILPCSRAFVSPRSVTALPELWLAHALHRQLDGSLRAHCITDRLASAIRAGEVQCDHAEVAWLPPPDALAAYAEDRWGVRTGREGQVHRYLRGVAAVYLAAAVPGCRPCLLPARTAAGRRRPDLLATASDGGVIAVELGAVDADSVHVQLADQGAGHVLVLPYAGVRRGYLFRLTAQRPLPNPSARQLKAAWETLVCGALAANIADYLGRVA